MATAITARPQSLAEIRTYYVDFSDDLPQGVTVQSATATNTPRGEGAGCIPRVSIANAPEVQVVLGPLDLLGTHVMSVLATLSNGDISEVRITIPVNF